MRHHTLADHDVGIVSIVDAMTLSEKAGQMTQVELGSVTAEQVATWSIGSVLSGGGGNPGDGSPHAWRETVESFVAGSRRSRLGIPILYGTDAVHGHNNVVGATIFPHNIAMGATADPDLMRATARASAQETAATGARWSFAPCLAVPLDVRWGRTYEGFSQDPELVSTLGRAAVEGWHGDNLTIDGVLACAKHYVGEGATTWGSAGAHRHPWIEWWDGWGEGWQIDQGDAPISEEELRRIHLAPFIAALDAGALTVMASYASWNGERLHGHHYLLTTVLKGELAFSGFVISDWMAIDQLDRDYATAVEQAVNAGVDMVMVPFDHERFITTLVELVESGRIRQDRIDDAVARILFVKTQLGIMAETTQADVPLEVIGCSKHRELARVAVRASAVVLVDRGVLPIPEIALLAAGEALDDVGIACGGWTISWEGSQGSTTQGSTILDGLRRHLGADRVHYDRTGALASDTAWYGIVAVHELPYVEGGGDRADLTIDAAQIELVRQMRNRVEHLVVVIVSGRPLLIEPIIDMADAVVACWLPGSEADGIADVLTGAVPFSGRLPVVWPRSIEQITGEIDPPSSPPAWPIGYTAAAIK